jgi:hypothetical protein
LLFQFCIGKNRRKKLAEFRFFPFLCVDVIFEVYTTGLSPPSYASCVAHHINTANHNLMIGGKILDFPLSTYLIAVQTNLTLLLI